VKDGQKMWRRRRRRRYISEPSRFSSHSWMLCV